MVVGSAQSDCKITEKVRLCPTIILIHWCHLTEGNLVIYLLRGLHTIYSGTLRIIETVRRTSEIAPRLVPQTTDY